MFASPAILPRLVASTLFSEADLYQARFAASLAQKGHADLVAGLTALVSLAVREGHVCLHLGDEGVRERLAALQQLFDTLMRKLAVGQAGQRVMLAGMEQLLAGIVQRGRQHGIAQMQQARLHALLEQGDCQHHAHHTNG